MGVLRILFGSLLCAPSSLLSSHNLKYNIEYHRKKFSLLEFSQRRSKFDFLPRSFAAHSKSPPQHLQTWMYGTPSSSTINLIKVSFQIRSPISQFSECQLVPGARNCKFTVTYYCSHNFNLQIVIVSRY